MFSPSLRDPWLHVAWRPRFFLPYFFAREKTTFRECFFDSTQEQKIILAKEQSFFSKAWVIHARSPPPPPKLDTPPHVPFRSSLKKSPKKITQWHKKIKILKSLKFGLKNIVPLARPPYGTPACRLASLLPFNGPTFGLPDLSHVVGLGSSKLVSVFLKTFFLFCGNETVGFLPQNGVCWPRRFGEISEVFHIFEFFCGWWKQFLKIVFTTFKNRTQIRQINFIIDFLHQVYSSGQ